MKSQIQPAMKAYAPPYGGAGCPAEWRDKSQNKGLRKIDRLLLTEIQDRFPVCARPYAELGRRTGLDEARVIRLLRGYRARGVVRRIGPRYDARACGLDTVLVALSVPAGKVREAAARINALRGVTHNYLRRHPLNIWFTLASTGRGARAKILRALRREIRPKRLLELPATRVFKLGVLFDLGIRGGNGGGGTAAGGAPARGANGRLIVSEYMRRIPGDLPLSRRPFSPGMVGAVKGLLSSGRMRRFGAVLDGPFLGYRYGALVAWRVPHGSVGEAGRALAAFGAVSHCYARAAKRAWPYRLYTMIHEKDRRSGIRLVREMSRVASDDGYVVLETARVLKRSPLDPWAVRLTEVGGA